MHYRSMVDSDCIVVMGSNMAENHPVAFRWPMKAKVEHGAKLIHVDPRFTRTSAMADLYAPIRAGSDIAFLGGLVNFVLNNPRWNSDPFFRTFVVNYTNAATIISDDFRDTEQLGGVFSGLMSYQEKSEWPYNGFVGEYESKSWQYARSQGRSTGASADMLSAKEQAGDEQAAIKRQAARQGAEGPPYDKLVQALVPPPAQRDETLQHPQCVFQIVRRHFHRYTPEMVERVTGCPRDLFLRVAQTILDNSGAERTVSFAYAVAWTQHTSGVQATA